MYEKLDRLRADVDRLKARIEDDKAKLKAAETRLKEAENAQIIADVGALSPTPEQLAQFLQMAANGQLGNGTTAQPVAKIEDYDTADYENEEREENEDED